MNIFFDLLGLKDEVKVNFESERKDFHRKLMEITTYVFNTTQGNTYKTVIA